MDFGVHLPLIKTMIAVCFIAAALCSAGDSAGGSVKAALARRRFSLDGFSGAVASCQASQARRRICLPVKMRLSTVPTGTRSRRAICLTVSPRGVAPTDSKTRNARETLRIRSAGSA